MSERNPRLATNNFDLLRLLFAGTVCLVHVHALSGASQLKWIANVLSSDVAVKAFFVVSGFLIFMSFERSSSLRSYVVKRVRRIYPAYFVIVMLCAVVLLIFSTQGAAQYFSFDWWKYVFANLAFLNFLQPSLPGVFDGHRLTAVNGALWTLKIEVMFYVSVPVFVWAFRRFGRVPVLLITYCLSIGYLAMMTYVAERTGSQAYLVIGRQLPGQLAYFMAGAFFYYYLATFERYVHYFVAGAVGVLAVGAIWPMTALEPIALATLVVFFGLFLYAGNFGKYGDFSYGVYIIHFPIIQSLIHLGWFVDEPWLLLAATVVLTVTGAVLMWHLVEKRFLLRSSHYVAAVEPDGRREAGLQ